MASSSRLGLSAVGVAQLVVVRVVDLVFLQELDFRDSETSHDVELLRRYDLDLAVKTVRRTEFSRRVQIAEERIRGLHREVQADALAVVTG
jgi:hypothetical protein